MGRLFLFFQIAALALLATACLAKPVTPPAATPRSDCKGVAPVHVVIGVAGRNLSVAARRTVLQAVVDQLLAQVRADAPGLLVSAYPLADQSVATEPLRLTTSRIEPPPPPLDLNQAPAFDRARLLDAHRKAVEHPQQDVEQTGNRLTVFGRQLVALEPPSTPADI